MSLYTPVFPSLRGPNDHTRRNSYTSAQNTQRYADVLRDVHLFLSTQGEELSPPSRPSSPNFEARVSQLRERVRGAFYDAKGEPSNGTWTNLSEQLKMGCVRGRYHALSRNSQGTLGENMEWILPETEEEWFALERKREDSRRLQKLAASQQERSVASFHQSGASNLVRANSTIPRQDEVREQGASTVSRETIQKAKEKVRKWQATIVPGSVPEFAERPPAPLKTNVDSSVPKGKALVKEKTSSSLNFPVVKRAAGTLGGKGGRRLPLGHPVSNNLSGLGDPTVEFSTQRSAVDLVDTNNGKSVVVDVNGTRKTAPMAGAKQKINDYPEMSYLPPSFPSHLSTSTPPQRAPGVPARTKPSPILPHSPSSSTPSPSTPPVQGYIRQEPRGANVSSCPPQFDTPQLLHSLRPVPSDVPIDSPIIRTKKRTAPFRVTPPAGFEDEIVASAHEVDDWKALPGETRRSADSEVVMIPGPVPTHRIETGVTTEKIPSPTKSYFSSHASSPPASPVSNGNLLLHSPESPIVYFPDRSDAFRPPYTSTQNGPKVLGHSSNNLLGLGYSSQLDVEKHVDRVNELLEKDVDFDSWLKDVNTVDDVHEERTT
ncbi:hypothetical protein EDC04DRAFT_2718233 [Pisolithus marmoratus]|nr:hypothetical protein EDC04DRAFT_2718233 [Pisolithus marmoratus]